jgi:hypothetical protein
MTFVAYFAVRIATARPDSQVADCLEQIRDSLPPDAVVATIYPEMVYLNTGKQAIKSIRDTDEIGGRWGDWEPILSWMRLDPDRPFYLWGTAASVYEPYGRHCELLGASGSARLERVYTSSDGSYWIDRIILEPAGQ